MLPTETDAVRRAPSAVSFGPYTFDRASRLLRSGTQELPLPPRVVGLLELLIARAGEIVPRQELLDSVWKDAFVTDTSLAEAVSFLRQALGDDPQAPTYIQTVHRRGYRFVAPVVEAAGPRQPEPPVLLRRAEPARVSPSIGRELVPWSIAFLCAILAAAALWQHAQFRLPLPPVVRMAIEPEPGTTFDRRAPALALSPDGTLAAWSACDTVCRLYVRPVDWLAGRPLEGTDDASAPFFSPDGRWIGFFGGGKLRKVALAGGLPIALTDAPQPFGAVWMDDQRIVSASSLRGGLLRVSERGGDAEPLTQPSVDAGEIGHVWPALAPGGRALLFIVATSPIEGAAGRVAIMDAGRPHPAWQAIIDAADLARAVSPDYIAFSRGGELHAAAFDRTRLTIAGPEQAVAAGMARAQFDASASGALIYAASGTSSAAMTWVPPGPEADLPPGLAALRGARLSPDGSLIAGVTQEPGTADVWVGDVRRGAMTRLAHGGINVAPVWGGTPSAPVLFYGSSKGGAFRVWTRDTGARAAETEVVVADRSSRRHLFPSSFAPADSAMTRAPGGLLALTVSGDSTRGDVVVVPIAGGSAVLSVQTPADEINGMLSPDGRFLAYQSDESGRWEIYLVRIADRRRTNISTAGGTDPAWSADGRMLLFRAADSLVSVSVDATAERVGAPATITPLAGRSLVLGALDGRILLRRDAEQAPRQAVLTLEWIRELRGLLGPPNATLLR
jgi:eukaryotic-like serine/threonine-protein kinase